MKQKSVQIQYGDVFIWKNFDQHGDGVTIKDAWFIYLGSNFFLNSHFFIRTTTQFQHYSKGQNREDHSTFTFDPEKNQNHSFFDRKCLIDCSEKIFNLNISFDDLISKGTLEIKGRLSNNDLMEIFLKLNKNRIIEKKVIIEIRNCLNNVGVYGLPQIQSRNKR